MRRWVLAVIVTCAVTSTSFATEDYETIETLVGWSADGARFAVVIKDSSDPERATLEVRDRTRSLAKFKDGDRGVPDGDGDHAGVERIDVSRWKPLRAHQLKPLAAAARARFKAKLEVVEAGKRVEGHYRCKGAGWTLRAKGTTKALHQVKAKGNHCLRVRGGYLHADGKHVLVKVTESWASASDEEAASSNNDLTSFVLVVLP